MRVIRTQSETKIQLTILSAVIKSQGYRYRTMTNKFIRDNAYAYVRDRKESEDKHQEIRQTNINKYRVSMHFIFNIIFIDILKTNGMNLIIRNTAFTGAKNHHVKLDIRSFYNDYRVATLSTS